VWSSLDESFATRLRQLPEYESRRVTVLSPLYAGPGGLKKTRASIPARDLRLYTDRPARVAKCEVKVYQPPLPAELDDDNADAFPATLHAKALVFHKANNSGATVWFGSANFTTQALTKSVLQGGNVELMVRAELPPDEASALEDDLDGLFASPPKGETSPEPDHWEVTQPQSTILGCELSGTNDDPVLIVHSALAEGSVLLRQGRRELRVKITKGQGRVQGKALRTFLLGADLTVPHPFLLYEVLRGREIPVIVNVAHVPFDSDSGVRSQVSLDALLEDLCGTLRVWGPAESREAVVEGEEEDQGEAGVGKTKLTDSERRLDEARHQGELDQLAVKVALLKKLVTRVTAPGSERVAMLKDTLETALRCCPEHLASAIREHLRA
jgi:hypothetical protein